MALVDVGGLLRWVCGGGDFFFNQSCGVLVVVVAIGGGWL